MVEPHFRALHAEEQGQSTIEVPFEAALDTISTKDAAHGNEEVSIIDPLELIGRSVRKHFQPFGFFRGNVISYDNPDFRVRYADGDQEDIDLAELLQIILPESPTEAAIRVAMRHPFWASGAGSDEAARALLGRGVRKLFPGHGIFPGQITRVIRPYFQITYNDGDVEEIDIDELMGIIMPDSVSVKPSPYTDLPKWLLERKTVWRRLRTENRDRLRLLRPICEGADCACRRPKYASYSNWPVELVDNSFGRIIARYSALIYVLLYFTFTTSSAH